MLEQVLALHTPVQHAEGLWHAWPVAVQAVAPQVPLTQLALQQSDDVVHAPPGSTQKTELVHTLPLQAPAQQGSPASQG
jgi:hypothetical protein